MRFHYTGRQLISNDERNHETKTPQQSFSPEFIRHEHCKKEIQRRPKQWVPHIGQYIIQEGATPLEINIVPCYMIAINNSIMNLFQNYFFLNIIIIRGEFA